MATADPSVSKEQICDFSEVRGTRAARLFVPTRPIKFLICGVAAVVYAKSTREFKQPRRGRQQKSHKFTYLTVKNNSFSRFARAFVIFFSIYL